MGNEHITCRVYSHKLVPLRHDWYHSNHALIYFYIITKRIYVFNKRYPMSFIILLRIGVEIGVKVYLTNLFHVEKMECKQMKYLKYNQYNYLIFH